VNVSVELPFEYAVVPAAGPLCAPQMRNDVPLIDDVSSAVSNVIEIADVTALPEMQR
jgi:hypothetical protein